MFRENSYGSGASGEPIEGPRAETSDESELPSEERERRAIRDMLPKLKRLVSSEDPRTLDSYFVEGLARTLEKKAKINAMDSELGIELLLLAGWLRGPRTPREGEDHPEEEVKKAFMNLKALVPTYEAE